MLINLPWLATIRLALEQ